MNKKNKLITLIIVIVCVLVSLFLLLFSDDIEYKEDLELKYVKNKEDLITLVKKSEESSYKNSGCKKVLEEFSKEEKAYNNNNYNYYLDTTFVSNDTIYYVSSTQLEIYKLEDNTAIRVKSIKFNNADVKEYTEINNKVYVTEFNIIVFSTITYNEETSTTIYFYDLLKYNLMNKYKFNGLTKDAVVIGDYLYFAISNNFTNSEYEAPLYYFNNEVKYFDYSDIAYLAYTAHNCYYYLGSLNIKNNSLEISMFLSDENAYLAFYKNNMFIASSKYNSKVDKYHTTINIFSLDSKVSFKKAINEEGIAKEVKCIDFLDDYLLLVLSNEGKTYLYEYDLINFNKEKERKFDGEYLELLITDKIVLEVENKIYKLDTQLNGDSFEVTNEYDYLKEIDVSNTLYYLAVDISKEGYKFYLLNEYFLVLTTTELARYDNVYNIKGIPFLVDNDKLFIDSIDGNTYIGFGIIAYNYNVDNSGVEYLIMSVKEDEIKTFQTFSDKIDNSVIEKMIKVNDYYCLISRKAAAFYEFDNKFIFISRVKTE